LFQTQNIFSYKIESSVNKLLKFLLLPQLAQWMGVILKHVTVYVHISQNMLLCVIEFKLNLLGLGDFLKKI